MLEHRAQMKISGDHPCLAGHFPGQPVVPAVVMLDCVVQALSAALKRTAVLRTIPAAKFLSPLAPDEEFGIELQIETDAAPSASAGDSKSFSMTPARGSARFRCVAGTRELAQGRLEYGHDEAP